MQYSTRLQEQVAPVIEPVSVDEAKQFLKLNHDDDNDVIADIIMAAREYCEAYTGRSFITRTYQYLLDQWPDTQLQILSLPKPPLQNVSAIETIGFADNLETYDTAHYYQDTISIPGRVVIKSGHMPPQSQRDIAGVQIIYQAGYGEMATDVPAPLRQAVLRLTAYLYENRDMHDQTQDILKMSGVLMLLAPYKIVRLP